MYLTRKTLLGVKRLGAIGGVMSTLQPGISTRWEKNLEHKTKLSELLPKCLTKHFLPTIFPLKIYFLIIILICLFVVVPFINDSQNL